MAITTRKSPSFKRRLNTRLRVNPIWPAVFGAVDEVVQQQVTEPRTTLATIREPRQHHRGDWINAPDGSRVIINHLEMRADGSILAYCQRIDAPDVIMIELPHNHKDRGILINGGRYHGFDYYSDTLSDADYALINEWIEYYWPESGTQSYVRFMGFLKHMELFADPLWTTEIGIGGADDSYPYLEAQAGQLKPVWRGGDNYPTSHVQLRYDSVEFTDVDVDDLFRLFYLLAPVHLVLERIVGDIDAGVIQLRSIAAGLIGLVETARSDNRDFALNVDVRFSIAAGLLGQVETAALRLPRRPHVPVLDLELVRNEGLRFAVDLGPGTLNAQKIAARFLVNGQEFFAVNDKSPRLYQARPGVVAVWVEPENLPGPLPDVFTYEMQVTSGYVTRTALRGTINLVGGPRTQELIIERNYGLAFNLQLLDTTGAVVDISNRDFYAVFYRNGLEVLRGSTRNGRLFVENNILGGMVPMTVLNPNDSPDRFSYRLLWRRKGSVTNWHEVFNGPIEFGPYYEVDDVDGSEIQAGGPTVGVIESSRLHLRPDLDGDSATVQSRDHAILTGVHLDETGRLEPDARNDEAGLELQSRPHALGPTLRVIGAGVLRIKTRPGS